MVTEGLILFLGITISASMFNTTLFTTTGSIMMMVFAQSITITTESNVTQAAEETNQTATSTSRTAIKSGALTAINETGQFVGNVSGSISENLVVTNMTGEAQEFFANGSK